MFIKKIDFYTMLLEELIKQEEYEMCSKIRDFLPSIDHEEKIELNLFDLEEFIEKTNYDF